MSAGNNAPAPEETSAKILVVEDEASILLGVKDNLEDSGDFSLFDRLEGGTTPSAEFEVMQQLPAQAVKDALDGLPEQFRTAVYLADVEGFSYAEIAEIMDTPIGTVMSRLHRGRKALQKALADYARQRGLIGDAPEDEA